MIVILSASEVLQQLRDGGLLRGGDLWRFTEAEWRNENRRKPHEDMPESGADYVYPLRLKHLALK